MTTHLLLSLLLCLCVARGGAAEAALLKKAQLGDKLSQADTGTILRFLKTLTGDQPRVEYPLLPVHTRETPQPEIRMRGAAH